MQSVSSLLKQISYESVRGDEGLRITDICYHSGKVRESSLFVCIKGQNSDGHDYAEAALEKGARVFVMHEGKKKLAETLFRRRHTERDFKETVSGLCVILVKDTRTALAELSAAFFDYPARKMRMIGITGTNGKTTTAYMVREMLRQAGYRVGMIGTIVTDNGWVETEAVHTTPEAYDLQKLLAEMVENHCDCCVMEVSSQGILMQRTAGIFFDIGLFLNIEPDHIGKGEHPDFANYLYCKSLLLQQCGIGIVNWDDKHRNEILNGHTCKVETFGIKQPADVMAEEVAHCMRNGSLLEHFRIRMSGNYFYATMRLPGDFNIYNAIAAVAAVRHFHVRQSEIQSALWRLKVPGRLENLTEGKDFAFLIDYAHNEMSLRKLLETLRLFCPKRLIVIFGCGGNRSHLRRYHMGETAGRLADLTIITSDNPRWEEPFAIMAQIEEGIQKTSGAYKKIADRREAICYASEIADKGDILVLAGKGHESYQEIKGNHHPMNDREIVRECYRDKENK